MANSLPNDALLCERCGYEMSPLGLAELCPECGADVAADVSGRVKSRWPKPDNPERLIPGMAVLCRPKRTFATLRLSDRNATPLLRRSIFQAAAGHIFGIMVPLTVSVYWPGRWPGSSASDPTGIALVVVAVLGYFAASFYIWIFTEIVEGFAVPLCRALGWRADRTKVRALAAHSAIGWGPTSYICLFINAGLCMYLLSGGPVGSSIACELFIFRYVMSQAVVALVWPVWFLAILFIGLRACRFANPRSILRQYAEF